MYYVKATNVTYVARVESQGIGGALGTAPEWLTRASYSVLRQGEQQLPNNVVVLVFELEPGPDDTLFECQWLVRDKEGNELFYLLRLLARVLEIVFQEVGVGQV